jgi:hypothetical protein
MTVMADETMRQVNYHLRDDQIAALQKLQEQTGCPVAESIRRAIDAYLARQYLTKQSKK